MVWAGKVQLVYPEGNHGNQKIDRGWPCKFGCALQAVLGWRVFAGENAGDIPIVNIEFYKPTIFGARIKFIPAIDLDSYSNTYIPLSFKRKQNVVVYELQKLIGQNKLIA